MLGLRLPELLVILVVVVLMFGSKKLPELGDALGKGIRAFKKASEHAFDEDGSGNARSKPEQQQLPHASTTTPHAPPVADPSEKKSS